MAMKRCIKYVIAAFALFHVMQNAVALVCMKEHPQSAVCRAGFVIKAKIVDTNWIAENQVKSTESSFHQPRIIRVELRKIFKGQKVVNATKYSQVNILYASPDQVTLKVGRTYVLTGWNFGPILMMNFCNWHSLWSSLSTTQRLGIERSYYWMFCLCRIRNCPDGSCEKDVRSCPKEESKSDCRSTSHLCMAWNGRCRWVNPDKTSNC